VSRPAAASLGLLGLLLAWSPDARPLGGYFLAGHLF
jgi:hypothetical protein